MEAPVAVNIPLRTEKLFQRSDLHHRPGSTKRSLLAVLSGFFDELEQGQTLRRSRLQEPPIWSQRSPTRPVARCSTRATARAGSRQRSRAKFPRMPDQTSRLASPTSRCRALCSSFSPTTGSQTGIPTPPTMQPSRPRTICANVQREMQDIDTDRPQDLPGKGRDMLGRLRRCVRECAKSRGYFNF